MNPPHGAQGAAIGIDIGGTKIAAGLVEFPGARILLKRILPAAPARGGEAVLADCIRLAEELGAEAQRGGRSLLGIGIGVCELVDSEGNVRSDNCIRWTGLPVRDRFLHLAPRVAIEADSRAAAIAEARHGAGRAWSHFFYFTLGTGIGSSLVIGGKPYLGSRGLTGTIASSGMDAVTARGEAVELPPLEDVAAGPALAARYNAAVGARVSGAEEVLARAEAGDAAAQSVVRSAGAALGSWVALAVNLLDPEGIVIGGGLSAAEGLYWDAMVAAARRRIWSDLQRGLPIVRAALGADAGIVGAAAAAIDSR